MCSDTGLVFVISHKRLLPTAFSCTCVSAITNFTPHQNILCPCFLPSTKPSFLSHAAVFGS